MEMLHVILTCLWKNILQNIKKNIKKKIRKLHTIHNEKVTLKQELSEENY